MGRGRRGAACAAALALAAACGVDVPPFVVFEPDGGAPASDGGVGAFEVVGVSPPSGPASGGSGVLVAGAGFVAGATVRFGAAEAPEARVLSPDRIFAVTPPGPAGLVPVSVRNPDGAVAARQAAYSYVP